MIANQKRAWAPSILRVLLVSLLLLAGNFSSAANAMSEPKPGDRRGPSYRVHLESMLSGGVAWLEVDSEYRVCAAKNMSAQAHCEPLEIPYLEAVTLSASKHGNGSAIGLTVPRGSQAILTDVRVALQNRFANEIARVQALVQSRYEIANRMANIANPLKLSAKTVLVSVNSACDIEELGAPMPLSTSDCAPPGSRLAGIQTPGAVLAVAAVGTMSFIAREFTLNSAQVVDDCRTPRIGEFAGLTPPWHMHHA